MKTVLIIEDEAQTRNIFLKCLEFEGFHAVGASDGSTGMKMAQKHQPDLVVCDIMMPDMDGYSVLSALRMSEKTASIPLIFLTAKVTMAELRRGMELGADDYLTKPCSIEQFINAVTMRLQRQEELERLYSQQSTASPKAQNDYPGSLSADAGQVAAGAAQAIATPNIFPSCPQLNAVFRFIEANFTQAIQLDDVAQEVGYSSAYLTTLMQEQTGHTVKRWIIERRMAHARELLVSTNKTVKQVAEASGYSDAGYFSRQFRRFHEASPQAWREASVTVATN